MNAIFKWFSRGAEFIAAMSLAAIFVTFLLQILFRYVPFLEPIGWSVQAVMQTPDGGRSLSVRVTRSA